MSIARARAGGGQVIAHVLADAYCLRTSWRMFIARAPAVVIIACARADGWLLPAHVLADGYFSHTCWRRTVVSARALSEAITGFDFNAKIVRLFLNSEFQSHTSFHFKKGCSWFFFEVHSFLI